ncbi:MAG: transposase family protein [Deltaproteobacteria bacterium]|nr:transposase family protein [Deltaproteobacteria bacterium]
MAKKPAILQRHLDKKARHKAQSQARKRLRKATKSRGQALVEGLFKTLTHFFPEFFEQLRKLEDCREKSDYELVEILMAGIAMFLFHQGSRNAFNNTREEEEFAANYRELFRLRLPHLDTVHNVMCKLSGKALEHIKCWMLRTLLEKKVLHKQRLMGKWFVVAVDGTGVVSFKEKHCEQCLHRTSKNGKTIYFHNVLEAKLITPSGFAISLVTEWIVNPDEYHKQDCERKAFKRLATQLKELCPRLPICIVADGLYPYQGFFDTCHANNWKYIVTLKDGNLPTVWEEVRALHVLTPEQHSHDRFIQGNKSIEQAFRWVNGIDYKGHSLNWVECVETVTNTKSEKQTCTHFVHVTNLEETTSGNVSMISRAGRLRFKIENEGFNVQKNHGYAMQHKYARVSWLAAKNYYQCLQIGHLINQLLVLSSDFQSLAQGKVTRQHLWQAMLAFLMYRCLERSTLDNLLQHRFQIRLIS